MVAVYNLPLLVHTQATVGVAVMGNAEIRIEFQHSLLQGFHVSGATVIIDVDAVRQGVYDLDSGP